MIETMEIRHVNWCARENGWRKGGKGLSRIFEDRGRWVTLTANKVGAISSGFHNFVRTALLVGKLGNFPGGGITGYLDAGHN